MFYAKSPKRKTSLEVSEEIGKLLDFWAPAFAKLDWPDRLQLLEQIDEEIRRDWRKAPDVGSVSEDFTAKLLDRLGRSAISCQEQADFYLNSLILSDRDAASAWRNQKHADNSACETASSGHEDADERRHEHSSGGPLAT
jgi:hypothetical protein